MRRLKGSIANFWISLTRRLVRGGVCGEDSSTAVLLGYVGCNVFDGGESPVGFRAGMSCYFQSAIPSSETERAKYWIDSKNLFLPPFAQRKF